MTSLRWRRLATRGAAAGAARTGDRGPAIPGAEALGLRPGERLELWSFAPAPARRAAEARFAAQGIAARIRPAWKSVLHHLLEEAPPAPGETVTIAWSAPPLLPDRVHPERFLRELHPAAELWPGAVRLNPAPDPPPAAGAPVFCRLLRRREGEAALETLVRAPLRPRPAPHGAQVLAACGWLRITPAGGGAPRIDGPWEDPVERALRASFGALDATIAARRWRGPGPHFGRLLLRIEAPLADLRLGVGEEALSLAEALHEELYFGALDLLRRAAGLPAGDRSQTPGEIVPEVVAAPDPADPDARVRFALRTSPPPRRARPRPRPAPAPAEAPDLETLARPMRAAEVATALGALGGRRLLLRSHRGRAVEARLLPGEGPAAMIGGGQHGNEPTGIPGALLAARILAAEGVPVAVSPLENPDGQAFHERLRRVAPGHMHHAARYTARGADLAFLPGGEGRMRGRIRAATGAELFVSLHGYPSHEWLHPFSGYLPNGFEDWSLPRGCFLILRRAPGWEAPARAALAAAARALQADPEIAALNARQLATLRSYAPSTALDLLGGVPVIEGPAPPPTQAQPFPATLVVETPDETASGPLFRLLARAQVLAAVAAVRAFRAARAAGEGPREPQGATPAPHAP